jgi:hypothetical protein
VPPPPKPQQPLTLETIGKLTPLAQRKEGVHISPSAAGWAKAVLMVTGENPRFCTIDEQHAHCTPLPPSIPHRETAADAYPVEEGGDLLVVTTDFGKNAPISRLYRASGELVADAERIRGAFSRADGTVSVVVDGKPPLLVTQKRGQPPVTEKGKWLEETQAYRFGLGLALRNEWGTYGAYAYSTDGRTKAEMPAELGTLDEMCWTPAGLLAFGSSSMSAYVDGRWTQPVRAKLDHGTWRCSAGPAGATATRVARSGEKLGMERCSPSGCELVDTLLHATDAAAPNTWAAKSSWGFVGGQPVALWATPRGVLKLRMAPLKELESAPVRVVFDSALEDGADEASKALKGQLLVTRDRFGLVLIELESGIFAFRLAPDGAVTPLQLD